MTQPRLLGGRYELDGVVGRGGMAEVYRARDIRLGPHRRGQDAPRGPGARPDLPGPVPARGPVRGLAEPPVHRRGLRHRRGHASTAPAHVPYIVMEYVDGRTLRELLRDDRRLLPERALEITDGVLRALDYSHRNGIVHRDIKPGNVMLTRSAEVKVMDFGIARAVSDAQATMTQTAPGDRHRAVPLARAGPRRAGRRAQRPVLDRVPALRAAHRQAAVHRRLPGRDRLPARPREPDPAVARRPGDPGLGRRHRAEGDGQGPGRPLPVRRRDAHRHPARAVRRPGRRATAGDRDVRPRDPADGPEHDDGRGRADRRDLPVRSRRGRLRRGRRERAP